jgi:hypothetical protein
MGRNVKPPIPPSGDMYKATYDADADDIVDEAKAIDDGGGISVSAAEVESAFDHITESGSSHSAVATNTAALALLEPSHLLTDFSGTFDWAAGGDESFDSTSGFEAYFPAGAPTVLEVGSNKVSFDVQASTAAHLWIPMPGMIPLHRAFTAFFSTRYKITTQTANYDSFRVAIRNNEPATAIDDLVGMRDYYSGGAGKVAVEKRYATAWSGSSAISSTSGHVLRADVSLTRVNGNATAFIELYSETSGAWIGGQTIALGNRWFTQDGDSDNPVLAVSLSADGGGRLVGELYDIYAWCR